jgi:hypothetical protein
MEKEFRGIKEKQSWTISMSKEVNAISWANMSNI